MTEGSLIARSIDEHCSARIWDKLRESRLLSAAAGSLCVGVAASGLLINTDHANGSPSALKEVKDLPGYGQPISPETRDQAQSSALVLVEEIFPKNGTPTRLVACGATKQSYVDITGNTKDVVRTAAHCFGYGIGFPNLVPDIFNTVAPALNYIDATKSSDGEVRYSVTTPDNLSMSLGEVTGISIMGSSPYGLEDSALLTVEPNEFPDRQALPDNFRSFHDVGSLPLDGPQTNRKPLPGTRVASWGINALNHRMPYQATGVYLGTVGIPVNGVKQSVRVVGFASKNIKTDGCLPGKSGSSAITNNGEVFSPVSQAMSKYYVNFMKKTGYYSGKQYKSEITTIEKQRRNMQRKLGISLGKFTSICYFQNPSQNAAQTLINGFSHNVTIGTGNNFVPNREWASSYTKYSK